MTCEWYRRKRRCMTPPEEYSLTRSLLVRRRGCIDPVADAPVLELQVGSNLRFSFRLQFARVLVLLRFLAYIPDVHSQRWHLGMNIHVSSLDDIANANWGTLFARTRETFRHDLIDDCTPFTTYLRALAGHHTDVEQDLLYTLLSRTLGLRKKMGARTPGCACNTFVLC